MVDSEEVVDELTEVGGVEIDTGSICDREELEDNVDDRSDIEELDPEPSDIDLENLDLDPEPSDIDPENSDLDPEPSDINPENSDLDDNSEPDVNADESMDIDSELFEPLYEGASITACGAYCALMEFKRACKLPFPAMLMLLQLLQLLCPSGNKRSTVCLCTEEIFPEALKSTREKVILSRMPHQTTKKAAKMR